MVHLNDHPQTATDGDALQRLLDREAALGTRQVRIPAGRYQMRDSLRLHSDLDVIADGTVVLVKAPSVCSRLVDIVGYGHSEFRVADPDLFAVGMGIAIRSAKAAGFGTTVARITARDGDTFFIDTPFHRDYRPGEEAMVWTTFPLVAGYGVRNVRLAGLTLAGDAADRGIIDGCRSGGVFLLGCRDICIDGLSIQAYPGDAISFQQSVDLSIRNCHLHGNAGHGLHPGSGSVRYVMQGNHVYGNGGCGIFYCLRTTHSICRDNRIAANGAEGISLGERDTDHLVEANRIHRNARCGLAFRTPVVQGADRVIVRGNELSGNGHIHPGRDAAGNELHIGPRLTSIHLLDNDLGDATLPLRIEAQCSDIVLAGNTRGAAALDAASLVSASAVTWDRPQANLPVGPASLSPLGARHLRIERLGPWCEPAAAPAGEDADVALQTT